MLGLSLKTNHVRDLFKSLLAEKQFTSINREATMTNLVGNTTIEIVNASFIADEDAIFGEVNQDYVEREEQWYNSMSCNVNDFPGGAPAIWKAVADKDGFINSNYGAILFSDWNGNQYENCVAELKSNPGSRRATAIYNRPSMWKDYNLNGRSDFLCTNAVGYIIRHGKLHAVVQMRSNDAWAGYRNDRAWQQHILEKMAAELSVDPGNLYWNVTSLHVYSRNYYLVDHYSKTGEHHISKEKYKELYPESEYV
jgi:thymidylate synthase